MAHGAHGASLLPSMNVFSPLLLSPPLLSFEDENGKITNKSPSERDDEALAACCIYYDDGFAVSNLALAVLVSFKFR